jgi:outer membrane receptor protein involved in Fe transport
MRRQFAAIAIFAVLVTSVTLSGGTAGKISGTVRSAENGEPLPGATVSVVGKSIVTVADLEGEFYLINLPVATYSINVNLIGYRAEVRSNVKVLLDLTTPLDVMLVSVPVPLDTFVTVVAERPLIQKDLTASIQTITKEELANLPNSRNLSDILLSMSGTVADAKGNLHVRGGRRGEVTYYFDGMPVQDQFGGYLGTRINPEALEEVDLASGGFSAEYGEALSGVVNVMTQEGSDAYSGKLKFADGATRTYDVHSGDFGGIRRTGNTYGVFNLSGPIPLVKSDRASFFNSVEYAHDGGYLPHSESKSWTITSKIALQPTQHLKLTLFSNIYDQNRERYQHRDVNGYSYDFALTNSGLFKSRAYRLGAKSTLQLSTSAMVTFKLGYFETRTKLAPDHLFDVYWDQWPGYSVDDQGRYNGTIQNNYYSDSTYLYTGFVNDTLFYPYYQYQKSSYKSAGFDLLSQLGKIHQVAFGAEFRQNRLVWDNKQFFNVRPYGEKYKVGPTYAAAYVQDKMEWGYLIVNAGLRLDYLNAEIDYWDDPAKKMKRLRSQSRTHLSPRVGFSHPVSENTVFHLNYGYYYQVPRYPYMFTNLQADLTTGYPIVGNPNMEPEKTISYELGVTQRLSTDVRLTATTYYKDVSNLVSSRQVAYPAGTYTQYYNGDYGSVKGLDIAISRRSDSYLSGALNYSYMIAEGNSSDANEFYYNYFTVGNDAPVIPVQKYPLAFDQRHTLSLNLNYRIPRAAHARMFGLHLPTSWGGSALFTCGSGMPYTKTDVKGNRLGGLNEGRMPANYRVDLKLDKDIYFGKGQAASVRLFVEVNNVFDRRNIISVYSRTGLANDDGYDYQLTIDPTGPATAEDVNRLRRLLAKDPQNLDPPRSIHWGLEWMF